MHSVSLGFCDEQAIGIPEKGVDDRSAPICKGNSFLYSLPPKVVKFWPRAEKMKALRYRGRALGTTLDSLCTA